MKSSALNVYGTYTVATLNYAENFGSLHVQFIDLWFVGVFNSQDLGKNVEERWIEK